MNKYNWTKGRAEYDPSKSKYWYNEAEDKVLPLPQYAKFCKCEKPKMELEKEIYKLKQSLEYQQKTYGEVDEIDLRRYQHLVQKSYTL